MPTQVVVASAELSTRRDLVADLDTRAELQVVGQAEDAVAVTELAVKKQPDMAVLDVELSDLVDACRWINRTASRVLPVVLRAGEDVGPDLDTVSLPDGPSIPVWPLEDFLGATRALRDEGSALDPFTARSLLATLAEAPVDDARRHPLLNQRQLEILTLRARGTRVPAIAKDLFISVNTVKSHLSTISEKLRTPPTS
jgi:DNA-binding NarL/FixJ family response regulator